MKIRFRIGQFSPENSRHLSFAPLVFFCVVLVSLSGFFLPAAALAEPDKDVIKVGVINHQPPQYVLDDGGEPSGFAVEYFEELARKTGIEYRIILYQRWDYLWDDLRAGKIDLIPSCGVTSERQQEFLVTSPIESFDLVAFVDTERSTFLKDIDERHVALVKNYKVAYLMRKLYPKVRIRIQPSERKAVLALARSEADVLIYNEPNIRRILRDLNLTRRIKLDGAPLVNVDHAVMVSPGKSNLYSKLRVGVAEMHADVKVYREIYGRWYGVEPPFWSPKSMLLLFSMLLAAILLYVFIWRYKLIRTTNQELTTLVTDLEDKIAEIKELKGILPICANCKKIRDDSGYWQQVEDYVSKHTDADFTHGICPGCAAKLYPFLKNLETTEE